MFLRQLNANQSPSSKSRQPLSASDAVFNLSRRSFLAGSGAFVVGVTLGSRVLVGDENTAESPLHDVKGGDASPSLWIAIEDKGVVRVTCHRSEMGQQVWTSMAQIVADELDADWTMVKIKQAIGHQRYGDQNTDGSRSVRYNFHRLRVAGAAMRSMLEQAAAARWGVDVGECRSELGYVKHSGSGQSLSYGQLAKQAGTLPLPAESTVRLKGRDEWRYIGKPVPSLTTPKITHGKGTFGIDVDRPGMVYAVVARPPQVFGTTGKFNDRKTLAIPGVLDTVSLQEPQAPALFKPLGGIAVVATDTWSAIQGRDALEVEWEDGPNAKYNSAAYRESLEKTALEPGTVQLNRGDTSAALNAASRKITADYYTPHLAQTPMEPPCATAEWNGDSLECWGSVQDPQSTRDTLVGMLGLNPDNVTVHATWLGGGFGRKSKSDFVVEAAIIAREIGKPVKVTWTREDDIRHGFYHAVSAQHFEAALDDKGHCDALLHRTVFPTIMSTFAPGANEPAPLELGLGATDNPFDVPNLRLETGKAEAHLRIGWLRSVCNIYHAFGLGSFAAELAHAAGRDPKDYLLELIGPPRNIDPAKDGVEGYPNYDASLDEYPIETGRLANVTRIAAKMAGWGRKTPKGHGLGIAVHRSFLTYVATVVEVAISADGSLSIPGVWLAADAGTVVNPRHARAQLEGGTLYGLSNALYGEITVSGGAVDQANFPDWRVMRMKEAPRTFDVTIVESNEPPAGIGEPATPPAAPALANAIFAATGMRIRELPILGADAQKLSLNAETNLNKA